MPDDAPPPVHAAAVPAVAVRRASPADAAALARFAARSFRDTYLADNVAANVEAYVAEHLHEEALATLMRDPRTTTLLAEVQRALAGYAQLAPAPRPASGSAGPSMELARFYVAREWHGRGVARELMAAALAAAARAGAHEVWLGVWERNARAIAFYRRSGFETVGAHRFTMGADVQRDLVMLHRLDRGES